MVSYMDEQCWDCISYIRILNLLARNISEQSDIEQRSDCIVNYMVHEALAYMHGYH